ESFDSELVEHWMEHASRRPWTEDEFPLLAAWLKEQQQPLKHVRAGAKNSRCYFPMIRLSPDDSMLELWIYYSPLRDAGTALSIEAMQRLGRDENFHAWENLKTALVVGFHSAEQPNLIGNLVGIGVSERAMYCLADVLHFAEYSKADLARVANEFDQLPTLEPMAEEFRGGERMIALDVMSGHVSGLSSLSATGVRNPPWMFSVDVNLVLRQANEHFDRMEAAADATPGDERMRLAAVANEQIEETCINAVKRLTWFNKVLSRQARSEAVGNILCGLLLPGVQAATTVDDRYRVRRACARAAIALAQYRAAHGEYPDKLAQLVPEFADQEPKDYFTGQPLKYVRTAEGYQLYCVGPNGQDDGGLDATQDDALDSNLH
ncbi:MAG: hypothetical protein WEA31_04880, partial [Pirellulales bacterium]